MAAINLNYFWKTKDIVRAYTYYRQRYKTNNIFRIIYFIWGIIYIIFGLYRVVIKEDFIALILVIAGTYLLLFNKIKLHFFGLNFKKLNYEGKQVELIITEEKITQRLINFSESTFSWNLVNGILDTPKGFILYSQVNMLCWLPKYAFDSAEDMAQFVYLAKDKVKNWQQIK